MMKIALAALSAALGIAATCARAAEVTAAVPVAAAVAVVPVGKGSYAADVPPEARAVVKDIATRELFVLGPERAIPTNKWWTNLLIDRYSGQLWAFPHQVSADKDGVNLSFPTRWNDEGRDPVAEFPLALRGVDFHPIDARANGADVSQR